MAERAGIAIYGPKVARAGALAPRATGAPSVLAVYGLKTDDYEWLAGFYPARRIAEACENRGIPLRFLFPRDVPAFLAGPTRLRADGAGLQADDRLPCGAGARADGTIARDRAIALVRGDVAADTYAILEAAGYRCVNDWRAASLARDKLETFRFLATRGYPTPATWTIDARNGARDDSVSNDHSGAQGNSVLNDHNGAPAFPVIAKPRFGSRGEGVALAHDAAELAAYAEDRSRADAGTYADGCANADGARVEYVAQEYIASSKGRDVRVLFAGGDVIAVAERTNGADELRSNACAGGETRLVTDGSFARWEAMTLDIAHDAGLWYGTVDWLYLPDGSMTVCEINSSPGFEALETCGIDVAGAIVDRLVRRAG